MIYLEKELKKTLEIILMDKLKFALNGSYKISAIVLSFRLADKCDIKFRTQRFHAYKLTLTVFLFGFVFYPNILQENDNKVY